MTPRDACKKAIRAGKRIPTLEPLISSDAEAAYHYAQDVVKGRWAMGEKAILTHPMFCPTYAARVLKRRWPAAEKVMTHPLACFIYASTVLKKRWPSKERFIRADAQVATMYAMVILKRRWKQAEATIAADELAAAKYLPLLKKTWTPAAASLCPMWMYHYAKDVIGGRLPTAMHNRMLALGLCDARNKWVKAYFKNRKLQQVKNPKPKQSKPVKSPVPAKGKP